MTDDKTPAERAATAAGLPISTARWLRGSSQDELDADAAVFAADLGPLEPLAPKPVPGSFKGGQRGVVVKPEPSMGDLLRAEYHYMKSAGPSDREIENEMRVREARERFR